MEKKRKPEKVGLVFENILKKCGYSDLLIFKIIKDDWDSIVGEKLRKICIPDNYSNGVLSIKVESSSWRNEFQYLKKEILISIKKHGNLDEVERIILL